MKIDKVKFIATFKSEAEGYITELNQGLVQLEKDPKNAELLANLFRAAHTLKGAAGMMGFTKIQDVAHKIEDLFGLIKEGKINFTSGIADVVFKAIDVIKAAVDEVAKGKDENINVEEVCNGLAVLSSGGEPDDLSTEEIKPPATPVVAELHEEYIRVPLSRINKLLNLIGEMVISKVKSSYKMNLFKKLSKQTYYIEKVLYELEGFVKEAMSIPDEIIYNRGAIIRASQEMEKAASLLDHLHYTETLFTNLRKETLGLFEELQNELFHLNPVIEEVQQKMKEIRMLPCSTIFEAFPRLIRDIAREQDKEVELVIKGGETELDKKVLEALKGPLIHLLRNAVDHGVKKQERKSKKQKADGTITLNAVQIGGEVVIGVSDDGPGINLELVKRTAIKKGIVTEEALVDMSEEEILNLIFTESFSTSPIITDVSGRGVGLDVVRTEMENLKGTIEIISNSETGTTILLKLPLTIAIIQVLLLEVGGIRWALPIANLERNLKIAEDEIGTIENMMVIQVDGHSVPVVNLLDVLGVQSNKERIEDTASEKSDKNKIVVVINSLGKRVGFLVDKLLGREDVFIKSIGGHLGKVRSVSGATIMASGEVVVILDPQDLVKQSEFARSIPELHKKGVMQQKKKRVLLVEDSFTTRELEKTILETHGYFVEVAIDGLDAMNKLTKGNYDVIVSDVRMPRMDGFELCKNAKMNKMLKDIPVIFVTALFKEEEKRKGIEVGAAAYITKNEFDQMNLLDTIERLI